MGYNHVFYSKIHQYLVRYSNDYNKKHFSFYFIYGILHYFRDLIAAVNTHQILSKFQLIAGNPIISNNMLKLRV
ncbi:uncharacterized protein NEPG_01304 [Nematocida parisii ERTm1]|uniref:Uncharacterized protein n=1 Tax=Nematocida parisii (strain ERTm3) TaxID=935791 RepID=I3EG54_NEMP3|nr:uncharacterized protein NEPG_01304 [Nematocida parisii ERTm1]EIJ88201.1 hypothetical protein NEQG_01645 [Nematocida parisii ERTm3]EIJ93732.1 hypothetical protein NEPG_01304 [Nematocida parisii ERTm1]|eukprot:XP_013059132.1 hypothetical protein NEPG_01304 [Nematocida parisii ERTm1]